MRNIITILTLAFILTGCSILKKEKYGCPSDGRNIGAEKLASGDEKAMKKSSKAKYRSDRRVWND